MSQPVTRKKFTELDDIKLIQIVNQMEKPDWKEISNLMIKWTPRQCRDRYNNYLSPKVQNKKWTKEEDQVLLEKYSIYGPKWSFLTQFFKNRAAVNIKNHYAKLFLKKEKSGDVDNNNDKNKKNDFFSLPNKMNHKYDIEIDDLKFDMEHDYLDFPIGFFSNEILSFIL